MEFLLKFETQASADRLVEALKVRGLSSKVDSKEGGLEVKYSIAEYEGKEKNSVTENTSKAISEEAVSEMFRNFSKYVFDEVQWQMNYLSSEVRYLENALYKHEKGHLPPIKGAGKMQQALTSLGLSEDYEVQKPVIRASSRGAFIDLA